MLEKDDFSPISKNYHQKSNIDFGNKNKTDYISMNRIQQNLILEEPLKNLEEINKNPLKTVPLRTNSYSTGIKSPIESSVAL